MNVQTLVHATAPEASELPGVFFSSERKLQAHIHTYMAKRYAIAYLLHVTRTRSFLNVPERPVIFFFLRKKAKLKREQLYVVHAPREKLDAIHVPQLNVHTRRILGV